MIKYLTLAISIALFGFASSSAFAGPNDRSTIADAKPYQVAAWNDRVCCKRGWQDWFTTRRACDRAGGRQVRNGQCRDDWNRSMRMVRAYMSATGDGLFMQMDLNLANATSAEGELGEYLRIWKTQLANFKKHFSL